MSKTEIIEIKIDMDIPAEIKKVSTISNTDKAAMARRVTEGGARIQKITKEASKKKEMDEKCVMMFEILMAKCINSNGHLTQTELLELAGLDKHTSSSFMAKLNRFVRSQKDGEYNIKKIKRQGETCYKLISISE